MRYKAVTYLREETRKAAQRLLFLFNEGKLPVKFWLVRVGGSNETIPYQLDTQIRRNMGEDLDIPIAILEELAYYKIINIEEKKRQEQKPRSGRKGGFTIHLRSIGWDVLLLPEELKKAATSMKKLKYRHLSKQAKELAVKLAEYRKENKISWSFSLVLARGDDRVFAVAVLEDNKGDIEITPDELDYLKELASEDLVKIANSLSDSWHITLDKKLLDAVEDNFSEVEDDNDGIPQGINFDFRGSSITAPMGINTGSGSFQQTQTINNSIADLKQLMQSLNALDTTLQTLFEKAEREPSEQNIKLLSAQVVYKAAEILANTGGAITTLGAVYKFVEAITKIL